MSCASGPRARTRRSAAWFDPLAPAAAAQFGSPCFGVCPGLIRTPLTESYFADESFQQSLAETVPQRRYGEPRDVANAALYLASELGSYVNGIALTVDGGRLAEKSFVEADATASAFFAANETAD